MMSAGVPVQNPPTAAPLAASTISAPFHVWVIATAAVGDQRQLTGFARQLAPDFEYFLASKQPEEIIRVAYERLPDLILTAGSIGENAAVMVRRRLAPAARIVKLGRRSSMGGHIDHWIQTAQYARFPFVRSSLVDLPFHDISTDAARQAAAEFWKRSPGLRRPLIAVMIGGRTQTMQWSDAIAARLAADIVARANSLNGTLRVSTSRRTGDSAMQMIRGALHPPHELYAWTQDENNNPYMEYLAAADLVIVTDDSFSMISEASALGKPVEIYPLPPLPGLKNRLIAALQGCAGYGRKTMLRTVLSSGRVFEFGKAPDPLTPTNTPLEVSYTASQLAAIGTIKKLMAKKMQA